MPYKDIEKRREAVRQSKAKRRETPEKPQGLPAEMEETPELRETPVDTKGSETLETPMEIPETPIPLNVPDNWKPLKAFIQRPSNNPKMTNLEKIQAIYRNLGKYADDVRYGVEGPTMGDIGRVLDEA